MSKQDYDDMNRPRHKRDYPREKNSHTGLIVILAVVIVLIALFLWLLLTPPEVPSQEAQSNINTLDVAVSTPSVIQTEPTSTPEIEPVNNIIPVQPDINPVQARSIEGVREAQNSTNAVKYITHVLTEGENLQTVAQLYGLKPKTLISINKITNIVAVTEGVSLQIPDRDGQIYAVRDGDMLSTIARKFNPNLGWVQLQEINGLKNENIVVGQEIFIPDVETTATEKVSQVNLTFKKPIDGTITVTFGQFVNGKSLDGLLISAPAGSAVNASADGAIVDAGTDSEIGRFVVIQHESGYKTIYKYLESVVVKPGQEVKQGDIIASIGTSKMMTTSPALFFQIEQSGIILNPSLFF